MSATHVYLSLIPQALIASMLAPVEFGRYFAVGSRVHSRGEAIFFEVDVDQLPPGEFPLELIGERCVAKADGTPKKSVYLAIYRVLSRVPVSALGRLHLVTRDGKTLSLERAEYTGETGRRAHLYQEFCRAITDTTQPVHVPRIVFSELALRGLAQDPAGGLANDLPYPNMQHLRDVLALLLADGKKHSKLVMKQSTQGVFYRTVRGGFYVGDQQDFAFYRFPDVAELEARHHGWWRSAQAPAPDI